MRYLYRLRPVSLLLFFSAAILTGVFTASPLLRIISLTGAAAGAAAAGLFGKPLKELGFYGSIFAAMTLINPVIAAVGNTPLFYLAGRPYTLEAMLYGANNAAALISSLIWFRLFSEVMDSEKIGDMMSGAVLSPFAAVMTLTLRYIPLFKERLRLVRQAHKAAGMAASDTWFMRLRSELGVFMSLSALSLELSAATADSMRSRGYTLSGKTRHSPQRFTASDVVLILLSALVMGSVFYSARKGTLYAAFYPSARSECPVTAAVLYGILCGVPLYSQIKEQIKWISSTSRN